MNAKDETPDKDPPAEKPQPDPADIPETDAQPDDAAAGGQVPESVPEEPEAGDEDVVPSAEDQAADLKDKLLRALAENENILRRTKREREDTAKFAVSNFARDMLMAADNLRRALDALPEDAGAGDDGVAALVDGVKLTERELLSTFERHGIRKIDPMGEKFDHDFHEAMFEVPTGDAEPGTVVQVVEVGYAIHDRLLRAAKVGIARAVPENGEQHALDTKV